MRLFALAALAVCVSSGPALAAPQIMALAPPAAPALPAAPGEGVRVGMRQQTLPVGGELPEDRQAGERYLYVVSGRLKVSDLVTGEEQLVGAGQMAAETPGDWHIAAVVGTEPVTLYVIDRTPVGAGAAESASRARN